VFDALLTPPCSMLCSPTTSSGCFVTRSSARAVAGGTSPIRISSIATTATCIASSRRAACRRRAAGPLHRTVSRRRPRCRHSPTKGQRDSLCTMRAWPYRPRRTGPRPNSRREREHATIVPTPLTRALLRAHSPHTRVAPCRAPLRQAANGPYARDGSYASCPLYKQPDNGTYWLLRYRMPKGSTYWYIADKECVTRARTRDRRSLP
jgi:hypothetical protein